MVRSAELTTQTAETLETTMAIYREVAPADRTLVFRLVGFYEYYNALQHFDALLRMVDKEELAVIEELVRGKDEFAVFTNLSRRLEPLQSSLRETSDNKADTFERRGLAWLMALARVELGAMLGAYTNVMSPFEAVRPGQYEMTAYKELLEDGLRTHYWALANDQAFSLIVSKSNFKPDSDTLAYIRRLKLAQAFHDAAARIGRGEHSSPQLAELARWKVTLDGFHNGLAANVRNYLQQVQLVTVRSQSVTGSETTTHVDEYAAACSSQLLGERYELQQGTAWVEVNPR